MPSFQVKWSVLMEIFRVNSFFNPIQTGGGAFGARANFEDL